ncbi:hypothetical protein [Gimesia chilikensis]|uniref:GYF domain-containing protein n=1 Tax=Gimesia chilikensis TaxID=2605989 RepID=A0A517PVW8_9PLAN|nr:hypothetical protein [Gimesia chilikensis]QDT23511.1 hypothetical protein HG66A1_53320 [Gimesia chilikensis]
MTEYPVPENRKATEWRFDDQGLLAGPYSYNELWDYVELDYIQPETEVIHEDGRKYQAYEIGLFPDFVPEKTDPADERSTIPPLPGWNFLAGVAFLSWITVNALSLVPYGHRFYIIRPYSMIIGGFAVVLIGCYTLLTGTAHDSRGNPHHSPVENRIAGLFVIVLGAVFLFWGFQVLLFSK